MTLTPAEQVQFAEQGFLIRPKLLDANGVAQLRTLTEAQLQAAQAPLELEAELDYPGAPTRDGDGAQTIRRLLQAHARHPLYAQWFNNETVLSDMRTLLGGEIKQARAHHNCIMTKQPHYSSDTGWHQDIRYWSFTQSDLISVWLALGEETRHNGCLRVIPGSHRLQFNADQFDERTFFRHHYPANQAVLAQAHWVELAPGDVLYFHARLLHAATRNFSGHSKLAVVASYRRIDNEPLPGSRSAQLD